ncbi:peptidase SpoIVB [Gottschalkia purinilytica]|uniref:Peptidase SpoIVB n=1 Tax=Gottschalkia purinilytica TaxID=1503 RepID=A0A0L0W7H4_GOTPU|nr:SpoIVB peptidase [Gottschalkia purinilytica]KNF07412.1 peptidase SpoIVB [Gottschalkia purinilytica]
MTKNLRQKKLVFFILILALIVPYSVQILNVLHYPSQIDITRGGSQRLDVLFPFTLEILENKKVLELSNKHEEKIRIKNSYHFKPSENGIAKVAINFLGFLPIKHVNVNVIDDIYLTPGGEALGVKLNTKGVLVVGMSEIENVNGEKSNPAADAGIKVGDSVTKINGKKIKDANQVIDILNNAKNEKLNITIERDSKEMVKEVTPIKSKQDNSYRLGIWVRDKTAGIGTLTFYDEKSKKFGALGHSITDVDTGTLMSIENGEIMEAEISSIEQGKKGTPGEIRGMFFENNKVLGKITSNTSFGIYGAMYKNLSDKKRLPIALQNEVQIGKAHILTTIENSKVEKYEVEILKKENQLNPETKSMVIKVTDKRLLNKTGGIVRGMSGSPIIQNGKIIGAVTHVFVNDPTKGYGLYIEWMMKEAGIPFKSNNLANNK